MSEQQTAEVTAPKSAPLVSMEVGTFLNVFKALNTLVEEVSVTISPEGFSVVAADPGKICIIFASFKPADFKKFEATGETKFGVLIEDIVKRLARFEKKEVIDITVSDVGVILRGAKKKFEVGTRATQPFAKSLPSINFDTSFLAGKDEILGAIEDISLEGEKVKIAATDKLVFSAQGDTRSVESTVEGLLQGTPSSCTYQIIFVQKMLKAIDVKDLTLQFGNNKPLQLSTQGLTMLMAPMVNQN